MQESPPDIDTILQPEYGDTDVKPAALAYQRRASPMPEAFELLADTLGAEPLPFQWTDWPQTLRYGGQFDYGAILRAHVYRLAVPNTDVRSHGNLSSHLDAHRKQADRLGLGSVPSRSTFSRIWKTLTDEHQEMLRGHAASTRRKVAATGERPRHTVVLARIMHPHIKNSPQRRVSRVEKYDLTGVVCTTMRIRTDGDYAHRKAEIEAVADFYGRNKTDSLMLAAEDVRGFARALERVLARDDLTVEQRRAICETVDRSVSLDVDDGLGQPSVTTD